MSDKYDVSCPDCGDYRLINAVSGDMNHVTTLQNLDGGTDDYLQQWKRFHCAGCDTVIAVLHSEELIND